jgi:uncharacterized LabA/DUF88 family protein
LIHVFTNQNHPLDIEQPDEIFHKSSLIKGEKPADIDNLLATEGTDIILTKKELISKVILVTGDKDHTPLLQKIKENMIELEIWGEKGSHAPELDQYGSFFALF